MSRAPRCMWVNHVATAAFLRRMLHVHNRTRQKIRSTTVSSSALLSRVEEERRNFRRGFSTEQRHRLVLRSGGDRNANWQRGASATGRTIRDRIPVAKLGGGHHGPQGWIRTVSSRGARGSKGLGRYVFRLGDWSRVAFTAFDPCEAGYGYARRARLADRRDAGAACCTARENVIDHDDITTGQHRSPRPVHDDCPPQRPITRFPA